MDGTKKSGRSGASKRDGKEAPPTYCHSQNESTPSICKGVWDLDFKCLICHDADPFLCFSFASSIFCSSGHLLLVNFILHGSSWRVVSPHRTNDRISRYQQRNHIFGRPFHRRKAGYETYQKEKAINKLAGPPAINPCPICTKSVVPIVPPIPINWICLAFKLRVVWSLSDSSLPSVLYDEGRPLSPSLSESRFSRSCLLSREDPWGEGCLGDIEDENPVSTWPTSSDDRLKKPILYGLTRCGGCRFLQRQSRCVT